MEAQVRRWERVAADPERYIRGEIPTAEDEAELGRLRRSWLGSLDHRRESMRRRSGG